MGLLRLVPCRIPLSTVFSDGFRQWHIRPSRPADPLDIAIDPQATLPGYYVVGNVAGLIQRHRETLDAIIEVLQNMGYRVFWCLLNARHHNVPQNRDRLFIIAVLRARCAHNTFPWPRDLPDVGINTILEALTRSEKIMMCMLHDLHK